ncbi:TAXI family TRAP transporter solute-binding subunit [Roseibium sp. HPY-6]|uniref:TAXI family TRAP transporter solute-binding subunit n=1 Tax=Roseibium sp. HPY-6 TaxID=3229852 RepID=UPI00338D91D7
MRLSNLAKIGSGNNGRAQHMRPPHGLLVASILAISGVWTGAQGNASEQHFITIGTAGVTGVYYPSGTAACKIVNLDRAQHGVRCSVESTLGSISNINQIRSGELDFGFAQSDWQHHAYLGTSVFEDEGPFEDLRSVLFLHPEIATIVVREGSPYRSLDDLKGARVDTGGAGSGSSASWRALIEDLDWSGPDRQNFSNRNSSELAEALCSDEIDAYFQLIGHPAALIEETQGLCDIRLVGIESTAVTRFVGEQPYYMTATIPADLYQLAEPVGSFGVVATVVTSAEMPEEIVTALVAAVHENFDSFKTLHPALNRLSNEDLVLLDATAPLHPGALTYFESRGLLPLDGLKSAD